MHQRAAARVAAAALWRVTPRLGRAVIKWDSWDAKPFRATALHLSRRLCPVIKWIDTMHLEIHTTVPLVTQP